MPPTVTHPCNGAWKQEHPESLADFNYFLIKKRVSNPISTLVISRNPDFGRRPHQKNHSATWSQVYGCLDRRNRHMNRVPPHLAVRNQLANSGLFVFHLSRPFRFVVIEARRRFVSRAVRRMNFDGPDIPLSGGGLTLNERVNEL